MQADELTRRDDERTQRVQTLQREVIELRETHARRRSSGSGSGSTTAHSPIGGGQEGVLRELVHEMELMRSDVLQADTEREQALAEASRARQRLEAERHQNSR